MISINKLTGKVGGFYEKIRYLIEYKEAHTVRRSAIERILVRVSRSRKEKSIGFSILSDLITGGYLPNNSVVEQTANDLDTIVNKYAFLRQSGLRGKHAFSLCATEIEGFLFPQAVNELVAECFYKVISANLVYADLIRKNVLDTQIYIACRRSLLDEDNSMLMYAVINKNLPELRNLDISLPNAGETATRLISMLSMVESSLTDPSGWRITTQLKDHAISFSVIREIINDFGASSESIFDDQAKLSAKIKEILGKKYQTQGSIATKSGNRAVGYILLTKIILAFILEVPYEKYFLGALEYLPLTTNVVFHPLLLLVIVKTIPPPGPENTSAIIANIDSIVHNKDIKPIHIKPVRMKTGANIVFGFLYLVLFVVSFSVILWVLNALYFNIVSILLFLFFLTLVSYLGFRIRYNANKWKVNTRDEGFLSLLWNFFAMPIVHTGQWLSKRFVTINIFITIMDFIIETPFKLILGTFDAFISFLKDKKDNPY